MMVITIVNHASSGRYLPEQMPVASGESSAHAICSSILCGYVCQPGERNYTCTRLISSNSIDDVLCAFESKHALPFYSELSRSSVRLLPVIKPRWRVRERERELEIGI